MQKQNTTLLIAFLSGMCALVYEIVWMRVFTPVFGLSVYATTTVLCAFMAGLGVGSILAPRVIRAWGNRSFWRLYCLLELGIGMTALVIPFSIAPIQSIYVSVSEFSQSGLLTASVRFMLSMSVMVVPTLFMGLTLPVLVHACREITREDRVDSRRIGLLYGFSTVGGALGCLLVGFVLLYKLGVWVTVLLTVGVNVLLALSVFWIYGRGQSAALSEESTDVTPPESQGAVADPAQFLRLPSVLALYGLIGFASFGFELCWFRLLVFYLQGAAYSFSIMLILYLLGIGLGSLCYSRYLEKRFNAASLVDSSMTLGVVQLLIGLLGILTLPLYWFLPLAWRVMVASVGAESWLMIILQKSLIAGAIILPPTFLMGIAFPLVARIYKAGGSADSTTVGRLYAANTFGAIVGVLVTGFVLFDQIGLQNALLVMSICSLGVGITFALKASAQVSKYRWVLGALTAAFVLISVVTPSRLLIANFEKYKGTLLFYRESASDIIMVHEDDKGVRTIAFSDGRGTSSTRPRVNYVNRLLAYSTMMMKPDAKDIAVISMGAGNTASAYTKFPIESLDIIDISSGPFEAADYFFTNQDVLADPRVHTHVEDGRNFLLLAGKKFDVIELEPPTLTSDGVVNLYTREFYEIAYAKLKPGGLLSQWIDVRQTGREASYMLIKTMLEVFPGSTAWSSNWAWWINGVKEEGPPTIDYERARSLFATPSVAEDMRSVDSSLEDVMSKLVSSGDLLQKRVEGSRVITDDLTIVDFMVPKLRSPDALGGGVGYYSSPLAWVFRREWKSQGTNMDDAFESMHTPFYETGLELESIAQSLEGVASGFPEGVFERILELTDRTNAIPTALQPIPDPPTEGRRE